MNPEQLIQPVPSVDRAHVERVVNRDFGADATDALKILDAALDGQHRVQLAVLKLAGGSLAALREHVAAANVDARDVLAWAEYPNYAKTNPAKLTAAEAEQTVAADWKQYTDWLER